LYIITDYAQLLRNCPLRRIIDAYVKLAALGARYLAQGSRDL